MTDNNFQFAAVPVEAISDIRLTPIQWRILCVVAHHDRFRRNGFGCILGRSDIASKANVHVNNVRATLLALRDMGYLKLWMHPRNGRIREMSVIYKGKSQQLRGAACLNGDTHDDHVVGGEKYVGSRTNHVAPLTKHVAHFGNQLKPNDNRLYKKEANREINKSRESGALPSAPLSEKSIFARAGEQTGSVVAPVKHRDARQDAERRMYERRGPNFTQEDWELLMERDGYVANVLINEEMKLMEKERGEAERAAA